MPGQTFIADIYNDVAGFRIWTRSTHDAILAAGLTDASSSTSITYGGDSSAFGSLSLPSNNTAAGHQVYKFNDALQATAPVFIKIGYGIAASVWVPALFITASGPDGATFNIPSGTAPTIRYHGDIWMEEDGLHYQSGSTNIGPLLT